MVLESGEPLRLELHRAGKLEGKVACAGQPVAGTVLEAEPEERAHSATGEGSMRSKGLSTASGSYSIGNMSPGRYRLVAHSPAFFQDWRSEPFELWSGESKVLDVELEKAVSVFGKVLLPNGEAVPGAFVSYGRSAEDSGKHFGRTPETDALGQYRLEKAGPGPGWLRVTSAGHPDLVRAVDLKDGVNEIDLVLEVDPRRAAPVQRQKPGM